MGWYLKMRMLVSCEDRSEPRRGVAVKENTDIFYNEILDSLIKPSRMLDSSMLAATLPMKFPIDQKDEIQITPPRVSTL